MRKFALLLTCLLLCGIHVVFAQSRTITGTVTDADDGNSLPGVSVVVKGTSIGTVTDIDGKFSLNVTTDAKTLRFSFVGFSTKEIDISQAANYIVALEKAALSVDEVVVTAYGFKKDQKALGYSATSVSAEEMSQAGESSVMNSLQGKVAGVNISSGGGSPGASTKVIIRGYSSLGGNNNPLYVVDGITISNEVDGGIGSTKQNGTDFGNGANFINPEDVESVNILKGAAATALYGSRAANGVIIITTKTAKDKGIKVEVSSRTGVSTPLRLPQAQNVFGQGWSGHWATDENGSWGPMMDGSDRLWGNTYNNSRQVKPYAAQVNNFKDFYDVGLDLYNSVSLSNATENSSFYLSYSNTVQDGVIPTKVDSYNRNTFLVKGSMKNKWITASGSINMILRDGSNTPDGMGGTNAASNLYSELLQIPRDFSIVDFKDYKDNPFNTLGYFYTPYATNPYYALNENKNEFSDNRIVANGALDFTLTSWLTATARVGMDITNYKAKQYEAIMDFPEGSPQDMKATTENPGRNFEYLSVNKQLSGDFIISAVKELNDDFTIDGIVGFSFWQRGFNSLDGTVTSLTIPNYYNLANTSGSREASTYELNKRTAGVFAQFTIDYKGYVYLNATARNDWSSTLPLDNNSFFYPSVSLSVLPSEIFPEITDIVNFSKIRASYGVNGNDADVYSVKSVMIPGYVNHPFGHYEFPLAGVTAFEVANQIGNPGLTPEISSEWEIGADLRFFKSRASIDISYYNKITNQQILAADVAPSSGYTTQVKNFGKIQNTGIELLLNVVPVKTKDFQWDVTVNFTRNRNYVLELTDGLDEYLIRSIYNTEYYAIAPDKSKGETKVLLGTFKVPGILKDDEGHIIVNDQGFPQTTAETEVIGSVQPDYMLGISNTFKYKNFKGGFTFDQVKGGMMYSGTADLHYFSGNATQTLYNNRQPFLIPNSVKPNPDYDAESNPDVAEFIENDIAIDVTNVNNPLYYPSYNLASERDRIIPKSFIKLRELYISYDLSKKTLAKLPIEGLSFTLTGRNLLLWTPVENNFVDPQNTSFGNDLEGEFGEFRTGPSVSTYTLGINIKF